MTRGVTPLRIYLGGGRRTASVDRSPRFLSIASAHQGVITYWQYSCPAGRYPACRACSWGMYLPVSAPPYNLLSGQ